MATASSNNNLMNGKKNGSSQQQEDEKNVRTLRKLATSVQANRYCFDCQQRGPTYVNVTVGSFVCTSCSGILRGLNPPHRIKSITMASFTTEEMEQIQSKGNEYCKQVWLGKYESSQSLESEYQNLENIKDFMIRKYEDKKYYVDPEVAMKKSKARAPAVPANVVHTSRSQIALVETKTSNQMAKKPTWLSQDFPSSGSSSTDSNAFGDAKEDPFHQTTSQTDASLQNSSFADFGSAFACSSNQFGSNSDITLSSTSVLPTTTAAFTSSSSAAVTAAKPSQKKPAPPPPDRYAALADLDNELHQQVFKCSTAPAVTNISSVGIPTNTIPYGTVSYHAVVPNPFGSHGMAPWIPPNMMMAATTALAGGNPFQAAQSVMPMEAVPKGVLNGNVSAHQCQFQNGTMATSNNIWSNARAANPSPWDSTDIFQSKDVMKTVIPIDGSNPWASQTIPSESANPFAGNEIPEKTSHANNPFL